MRKWTILLVLSLILLAGCAQADSTEPVLTLIDLDGSTFKTYTLAEFKALPAVEGYGGFKLTSGEIEVPEKFTGVPLAALGKSLSGFTDKMGLKLTSTSGESVTVSYKQLLESGVVQYGPLSGTVMETPIRYTAILAYRQGNKALKKDLYGDLRLAFISEERNQVVDESWRLVDIASVQLVEVRVSSSDTSYLEYILPQLFGDVVTPIPLTSIGLEGFNLTNVTIEDDLGHQGEYFGIYFKELLEFAKPLKVATAMQFTNADGITARVLLEELAACQTCMLGINPDGTLHLVMPGLPDAWWLENVKLIEIR